MTKPEIHAQGPIDLAEIRRKLASQGGKPAWRSLDEMAETEEFLEFLRQEFPRQAETMRALSRRDFLKLLAAPLALAGLTACVPQPLENLMPYTDAPENLTPGKSLFFATAMERDGYGQGLLAESREGRPIKIEGNPLHPLNLGATDAFAQAALLDLYDPDRAQVITDEGSIRTWDAFLADISGIMVRLRGSGGAGLRLLTGTVTSPTLGAQIRALLQSLPEARWHQYEPVGRGQAYAGAMLAFGQPVETIYNFAVANVVLSLDSDFLHAEPGSLRYSRDFMNRRQILDGQVEMNRLYVIESRFTLTGAVADNRLPVQASQVEFLARALAARLGISAGGDPPIPEAHAGWLDSLAADLQAAGSAALVVPGAQQSPAVHALAHAINATLGSVGICVSYTQPVAVEPIDSITSLRELAQALDSGQVELLVTLGGNPVYTAPADLNFSELYQKAAIRVYLGMYADETAARSTWLIPAAHFLEMWGDTRSYDGTATIIQPLIQPLYGGRSPYELLAILLDQGGTNGFDIIRNFWQDPASAFTGGTPDSGGATGNNTGAGATAEPVTTGSGGTAEGAATPGAPGTGGNEGGTTGSGSTGESAATPAAPGSGGTPGGTSSEPAFELSWKKSLHDGLVAGTARNPIEAPIVGDLAGVLGNSPEPAAEGQIEIVFEPDTSVWDGRFTNNAWLQELPRPLTKITWDNAALISTADAERLSLSTGDVVDLVYRERSVQAPVWVLPGQPQGTVTVNLGYGRTQGGNLAPGVGFNAYALRTSDAPWFGYGLEIRKTGRTHQLAHTQGHFQMEGREIARSGSIAEFRDHPEMFQATEHGASSGGQSEEVHEPPSMYPEWEYEGYAWGMSINLNTCIGCNACVVACQSENNIPVVGRDQVLNSREMHWLRVDTYYEEDLDLPRVTFAPVPCMHCEKAPCEPVCPVEATSHSSEGLNEMTYNRCVGTRYCSNNCPYKVRRFNFLEYVDHDVIPLQLMRNPDVTVRDRGVMEKCTYCVQRINRARIQAEVEGRTINEGEVVTACQQACPTRAIVFGDINRPESEVRSLKDQPQNYAMLAELGTQPRTTYLAKLRNPNEEIQS